MGLVDYLSGHLVGTTPKTSKLDNIFMIAQTNAVNRLIAPSASVNVDELKSQNEKKTRKKTRTRIRHRNEMHVYKWTLFETVV